MSKIPIPIPQKSTSIVNLLEQVIIFKSDKAYSAIFEILKPIIFNNLKGQKIGNKEIDKDSFYNWLFAWFWTNKSGRSKLFVSYEKIIKKIEDGEVKTEEEQKKAFINYCSVIFRQTAISEYSKELNVLNQNVLVVYSPPSSDEENDCQDVFEKNKCFTLSFINEIYYSEQIDAISNTLEKIPNKYAIPLILKSKPIFEVFGLSDEQLNWLSEISGKPKADLSMIIDNESHKNSKKKFPLSSNFIAELFNTSQNNVDKRFKRALKMLKDYLNEQELL